MNMRPHPQRLTRWPPMAKLGADLNFVALDLEFNQPSRRIIQVGLCLGRRDQAPEEYRTHQWLVNPGERISPEIEELTGISDADVANGLSIGQMTAAVSATIAADGPHHFNPVVWGDGDTHALREAFQSVQAPFPFGRRSIDVKTWHAYLCFARGESGQGGLSSVMRRYGVPFLGQAHRADVDACNTLRLFQAMLVRQERLNAMVEAAALLKVH